MRGHPGHPDADGITAAGPDHDAQLDLDSCVAQRVARRHARAGSKPERHVYRKRDPVVRDQG